MMKNNLFQKRLMEEINKKIPQRSRVVNFLSDLLAIEKEAVYRRLRAEVPFTFNEVAAISKKLNLSVDDIIDTSNEKVSPFKLRIIEYTNPTDADFPVMDQLARFLNFINSPDTESIDATATLPIAIYTNYKHVLKFYLFKWYYFHNQSSAATPYQLIEINERMDQYYEHITQASYRMGYTRYVFDFDIFHYLVNDIVYFKGVNLLKDEEVTLIKEDLFKIIDYLEELTVTGVYKETRNPVQIYISNVNFPTSYSLISTTTYKISFIKAFTMNSIISFDPGTYVHIKKWLQSVTKACTLITESGEIDRIKFFDIQRKLINTL